MVTTAQCLRAGMSADRVERLVRRGEWRRLHRGVMVTHNGPLTWRVRAVAALLYAGAGAALSHGSAAYVHGLVDRPPRLVEVSVRRPRQVTATPGVRIRRRTELEVTVLNGLSVTSLPTTVLDLVASARSDDDAVGLVTRGVRAGLRPQTLLAATSGRSRLPGRALLLEVLAAVDDGAESPLERRYHRDVERRHGLPRSTRQRRELVDGHWIRADAVYDGLGVRVELDGALAHPAGRTDRDTWRDNAVLIERGDLTLRYRWSHVRRSPCTTAAQVGAALRSRGWRGRPRACSPTCAVVRTL